MLNGEDAFSEERNTVVAVGVAPTIQTLRTRASSTTLRASATTASPTISQIEEKSNSKNADGTDIKIKPITLNTILAAFDMYAEQDENGRFTVFDEQRDVYFDNDLNDEEGYTFADAAEIFERLDTYVTKAITDDMEEQLEINGVDTSKAESL